MQNCGEDKAELRSPMLLDGWTLFELVRSSETPSKQTRTRFDFRQILSDQAVIWDLPGTMIVRRMIHLFRYGRRGNYRFNSTKAKYRFYVMRVMIVLIHILVVPVFLFRRLFLGHSG